MALRKSDKNQNSAFNKITISLTAPETILENSHGEVLNQKQSTTVRTNQSVMVSSVSASSVLLRITSVLVVNTSVSVTRVLFVTVVVLR